MEQLCWKCRKATNGNLCPWVREFIYPDGVKLDRHNRINYCPIFESDIISTFNEKNELIKRLGISERSYYRYKYRWIIIYNKYKHYENLPTMNDLCTHFNTNRQKIRENYEEFLEKYLTSYGKTV